jgi:division protein CdvB (Snf7/Vps24/ESCRT-III family)
VGFQTVRTNEQMMQAMKGATGVLGSMNRNMNLPALQRIAMEFEKENDIMDQRQEMMDDAIDDVTGLEDEAEGEEVVEQVLEEIGVDLRQAVSAFSPVFMLNLILTIPDGRNPVRAPEHRSRRRQSGTSHWRRERRWGRWRGRGR